MNFAYMFRTLVILIGILGVSVNACEHHSESTVDLSRGKVIFILTFRMS